MREDDTEADHVRRKLREQYYDRKVARAEEMLPYIVLLVVICFCSWFGWVMWAALGKLMQ